MPIATLNPVQLSRATLARQLLLERVPLAPAAAISQLCALQAQEPRPPYLALWSRIAGFAAGQLTAAVQDRSVLRVTLMFKTERIDL